MKIIDTVDCLIMGNTNSATIALTGTEMSSLTTLSNLEKMSPEIFSEIVIVLRKTMFSHYVLKDECCCQSSGSIRLDLMYIKKRLNEENYVFNCETIDCPYETNIVDELVTINEIKFDSEADDETATINQIKNSYIDVDPDTESDSSSSDDETIEDLEKKLSMLVYDQE